jgi:hypothetical protein
VVDNFEPPIDWPWLVGWDPGRDHPTGIPWLCIAPNDDIFVCDEQKESGKLPAAHVADIRAKLGTRWVRRWYGDPHDFFSDKAIGDSIATQVKRMGMPSFIPWGNQKKEAMVYNLGQMLANAVKGTGRKLFVQRRCRQTIGEFQSWSYKRNTQGEQLKGDDMFDDANNDCIYKDTLIWTDRGRRQIQDMVGEEGLVWTPYGWRRFYNVHQVRTNRACWEYTFCNGASIKATADHEVQLVDGSWKALGCIERLDRITLWDGNSYSLGKVPILQRLELLQGGCEAVLPAGGAMRIKPLWMARRPASSRCVGIPPWTDPYRDAHSPQGREQVKQFYREYGHGDSEGSHQCAHDTKEKAKTCRMGGSDSSFGKDVAFVSAGIGVAQATCAECGEQEAWNTAWANERTCKEIIVGQGQTSDADAGRYRESKESVSAWGCGSVGLESAECLGIQPVYDMSVEELHCFVVNDGLVVSNCLDAIIGICALNPRFKSTASMGGGEDDPVVKWREVV